MKVQTFRSGGKGGQHQNKRDSGVRIKHPESGAVGESRNHRSQHRNKKEAFQRMVKHSKFQSWHKIKAAEIMVGKRIEDYVDEMMAPYNLKVEYRADNKWIEKEGEER